MNGNRCPIVMTEEIWRNSQLSSLVRFYGRVNFNGREYIIVDKRGHDIFECSAEAEKAGREKAIEPGEPVDLCLRSFVPIYRELGREKFFRFLQENPDVKDVKDAKRRLKIWEQQSN